MRLVILGSGAIGGAVGAHLALAGRDVLLVARGAHLAAMRDRGLRLERPDGTFDVRAPVHDVHEPVPWRDGDVLAVAVKTQDVAGALREVAPPPGVPIACLTNGLEAERIALRHARDVYGAYVYMPATYLVPGVVQVWAAPVPGFVDLGRYPDGTRAAGATVEDADAIAGELVVAGFASEVRPTIMKWKRGKLLSNLGNAIEALCGPGARRSDLADRARAEGRACFAAAGLSCTTDAEEAARRGDFASRPIAGATRSGGSTWQSLARGQAGLETDYLNGEIVLLGRLHGVATPVNEALQRIAAEAARAHVAPGSMSLDELDARVTGQRS
jgi:2-dehydropantoate 2-reductase